MNQFSTQSGERTRRVLVVDDDASCRAAFVDALQSAGYEVGEAWGAAQAMRLILSYRPDVVMLELVLPDGLGIEVGRAMRAIVTTSRTCVVAVTSAGTSLAFADPASFGAEAILFKPVTPRALIAAVGRCFGSTTPNEVLTLPSSGPTAPATEPAA
jgi:two-component system phosphate regulon response regulator OmpR